MIADKYINKIELGWMKRRKIENKKDWLGLRKGQSWAKGHALAWGQVEKVEPMTSDTGYCNW